MVSRPWIRDASDQAEIARIATELWHRQGRPPGRQMEFFLEAQRQFAQRQAARIRNKGGVG